jgi:hypothetical protein
MAVQEKVQGEADKVLDTIVQGEFPVRLNLEMPGSGPGGDMFQYVAHAALFYFLRILDLDC